jgi:DNA-binding SARP family transcriptional activator
MCPLIARDPELQSLVDLWRASRLVTLYGQSGVGKSLLARTAVDRLTDEGRGEVRCVDAGSLTSGAALLRVLTRVRRRTPDKVVGSAAPGQFPLFLLLDDLPSVTREAMRGLLQWLVLNPEVHLLVVARRPLDLVGEVAMPLAPLGLSAPDGGRSPAAELFGFYARRAGRGGSSVDGEAVGTICRALDGLPAALEAAAGLVGAVSVAEIVRISRDEPLSLGLRGRLVAEMAAETWRELPEAAQEYLRANAGWPGAFDAESGRCMVGGTSGADMVAHLVRLGLLQVVDGSAQPGFRIANLLLAWMRHAGTIPSPDQEVRGAMSAARHALALGRRHGFVAVEAAALMALASAYTMAGDGERAEGYFLEATAVAERCDDEVVRRHLDRHRTHLQPGAPDEGCDFVSGRSAPAAPISSASSRAVTASPTPPLLIRLLGPLTVEGPRGELSAADLRPKEQRVLARLALSPGEVVPRDELLDLFWHRSPVASAERSLRTVVSSLRSSIRRLLDGPPLRLISGRGDGYQLEAPTCAVDADLFARVIREAREASAGADLERARSSWRRAEELYRGDLLLAFQYEDWCLTARERLRSQFLDLLFQLASHAMAEGDTERACRRALRMVEIDPTEERAHRLLMRCYVFLDRPAEALRQFERCRTALCEELAARPGAQTLALLQAIREGVTIRWDEEEPEPIDCSADSLLH